MVVPPHRTAQPNVEPHTDNAQGEISNSHQRKTTWETPMDYESSPCHRGNDTGKYGEAVEYMFGWNEDNDVL